LSEHHQKTFISAPEFIKSWDKELYELNNLDFFIFLMINHLGNQLEKRFFNQERRESDLYLSFDHIGTVCFNVGDSFEYFLEENCLSSCPIDCPRDMDGQIDSCEIKLEDRIKRKLELLQSFLVGQLDKEQCFRIDLMNHVILDTLLQFYSEELDIEFEENDWLLLELAEFIENTIIEFIRFEGVDLLHKPFENALEYFEDLLQRESDSKYDDEWQEDIQEWQSSPKESEWQSAQRTVEEVLTHFLNDEHYNSKMFQESPAQDIEYLNKYLKETAKIRTISEFNESYLAEFMSVWLAREFVMSDTQQISHIFRATARFITFLYHHYQINLKKEFLKLYDQLKTDLARTIQATNTFISEYKVLDALLDANREDDRHKMGFFEVVSVKDKLYRIIELKNIYEHQENLNVKLNSSAIFKLRKGDILHVNIIKRSSDWEILEIQYIYPSLALQYI
jgi:hypothetical protein